MGVQTARDSTVARSLVSREGGMKITILTEREDRRSGLETRRAPRGDYFSNLCNRAKLSSRRNPASEVSSTRPKGDPQREMARRSRSRLWSSISASRDVSRDPSSTIEGREKGKRKQKKEKKERRREKSRKKRGMSRKGGGKGVGASKRCNKLRIKCGSRFETRGSAQRRIKHTYTMYTLLVKPKRKKKKKRKKKREKNREGRERERC